jgi:hypothetical protein
VSSTYNTQCVQCQPYNVSTQCVQCQCLFLTTQCVQCQPWRSLFPLNCPRPRRALKRVGADNDVGREKEMQNVWAFLFFVCVFLVRWWKRPRVEPSFFFVWSHPQTKQNAQMSNNAAHRFRVLADVSIAPNTKQRKGRTKKVSEARTTRGFFFLVFFARWTGGKE